MVLIPGGSFEMGSPAAEEGRDDEEGPVHTVRVSPFWMGKYEVTQGQWEAVMGSNPSYFKGPGNPVENVSWNDCQEFIKKLNEKVPGGGFRLPSEAEWEYACRAGTRTPFNTGETISTDEANYDGNYTYGYGRKGVYREKTTPVGSFKPNAWGLYDMHGNVWEWCQDWCHDSYTGAPSDGRAWESPSGSVRVLRGGSWNCYPWNCRSSNRLWYFPVDRKFPLGFRFSRTP
jgi:formylglycine-generating enzyme required for sulfatase activity